jgi:hypothetical protein
MTDNTSPITVEELRELFNILMDHLEKTGTVSVKLDRDFFWSLPQDQLYNVYEEPKNLNIAQLSESLDFLNQIRLGQREPVGFALVWLADVLRAIGHRSIG